MNIVVPIRLVPDLVEEIAVDAGGTDLDRQWLRLIVSEFDDHAIEQAVLLKERIGGQVTVIAPECEGVDDVLFTAAAKDADRLIKITEVPEALSSHALARALATVVGDLAPDLVVTGVQANDDRDGSVGPILAELLALPYVGYVSGVSLQADRVVVRKEYPGGLIAEMEAGLPAVLGIQSAEQPPRYVAVSKVRQAMRTATIEEHAAGALDDAGVPAVERMHQPQAAARAEMIEGDDAAIAARLVELFRNAGAL